MKNSFIGKINYIVDILAAFILGKFNNETPKINQAIKQFSFSQAAIDSAIIINSSEKHTLSISFLIILVPIFLTMGVAAGLFSKKSESNPRITSIGIISFILITATHTVVMFFHYLIISVISGIALIVGILISIRILIYCLEIYFPHLDKQSEE